MIKKKFVHFNSFANFATKKLSADVDNTTYTIGLYGGVHTGTPDIMWLSTVYIADTKSMWTHGWYSEIGGLRKDVDNITDRGVQAIKDIAKQTIGEDVLDYIDANGYEYVDLGLPSGTLWATCNVGASKPEEYGLYFQWADTQGYPDASQKKFEWPAPYAQSLGNLQKYTGHDGLNELEVSDDAARANMGGTWLMPSDEDFNELTKCCTRHWTGSGYKIVGPNGNSILLPAAGYGSVSYIGMRGSYGRYWSSSLLASTNSMAMSLYFNAGYFNHLNSNYRCFGLSVRGVLKPVKLKENLIPQSITNNISKLTNNVDHLTNNVGGLRDAALDAQDNINLLKENKVDTNLSNFDPKYIQEVNRIEMREKLIFENTAGKIRKISVANFLQSLMNNSNEEYYYYEGVEESEFVIDNGVLIEYNGKGGDIIIPEGVRSIADLVFSHRDDVYTVTFPSTLNGIGCDAFANCHNLISVSRIQNMIIEHEAFYNCSSLCLTLGDGGYLGERCFWNVLVVIDASYGHSSGPEYERLDSEAQHVISINDFSIQDQSITKYKGSSPVLGFPYGYKEIGYECCKTNLNIKTVIVPHSYESMGREMSFYECENLTTVIMSNSIRHIGDSSFNSCFNLKKVILSQNLETIYSSAFSHTPARLIIPKSVNEIGVDAFHGANVINLSSCRYSDNWGAGSYTDSDSESVVDLGLPSGTLWAKCNVGASTEPSMGDKYMWASLIPGHGKVEAWSKYEDSTVKELELVDDVAHKNAWYCKIPSKKDFDELITVPSMWVGVGNRGRRFMASNGNSLFLPTTDLNAIDFSTYWTSSNFGSTHAYVVESNLGGIYFGGLPKDEDLSIRPIVINDLHPYTKDILNGTF